MESEERPAEGTRLPVDVAVDFDDDGTAILNVLVAGGLHLHFRVPRDMQARVWTWVRAKAPGVAVFTLDVVAKSLAAAAANPALYAPRFGYE